VKQKLERYKQLLRLERRKKARTQEKAKRLTTSLNGIKVESHKQKQLLNKFNFLLEIDSSAGGGKLSSKFDDDDGDEEEVHLEEFGGDLKVVEHCVDDEQHVVFQTTSDIEPEVTDFQDHELETATTSTVVMLNDPSKINRNNVSLGTELIRRMSSNMTSGKISRKGLCVSKYLILKPTSRMSVMLKTEKSLFSLLKSSLKS
jgi:hypothetical protein